MHVYHSHTIKADVKYNVSMLSVCVAKEWNGHIPKKYTGCCKCLYLFSNELPNSRWMKVYAIRTLSWPLFTTSHFSQLTIFLVCVSAHLTSIPLIFAT